MPSWLQLISRVAAPAALTRVFLRETANGSLKRKSPGGSLTSPPDSGTASIAACKLGYFAASITTAGAADGAFGSAAKRHHAKLTVSSNAPRGGECFITCSV